MGFLVPLWRADRAQAGMTGHPYLLPGEMGREYPPTPPRSSITAKMVKTPITRFIRTAMDTHCFLF